MLSLLLIVQSEAQPTIGKECDDNGENKIAVLCILSNEFMIDEEKASSAGKNDVVNPIPAVKPMPCM